MRRKKNMTSTWTSLSVMPRYDKSKYRAPHVYRYLFTFTMTRILMHAMRKRVVAILRCVFSYMYTKDGRSLTVSQRTLIIPYQFVERPIV